MRFFLSWLLTFVLLTTYSGFAGIMLGGDLMSDLLPAGLPTSMEWFKKVSPMTWFYWAFVSGMFSGFFRLIHLAGGKKAFEYCFMLWGVSSIPPLLLAFMKGVVDRQFVITHLGGHFVFFVMLAILYSLLWKPRQVVVI